LSYPPITNGTRRKVTVRRSGKGDYNEEAIEERSLHNSKIGVVYKHSSSGSSDR